MTLRPAIDAGLRVEQGFSANGSPPAAPPLDPVLPDPPAVVGPAPVAAPVTLASPEPPPVRRRGRGVLRLIRPVVLPFLDRLDSRIRWAVDRSTVATRLADAEARAMQAEAHNAILREASDVRMTDRLDRLGAASARIEQNLAALAGTLEAVTHRLDTLEIGLGAIRQGALTQLAVGRRTEAALAAVAESGAARDRLLQDRLDGTAHAAERISQAFGPLAERLGRLEEAGGHWVDQRMAERFEAVPRLLAPMQDQLGSLLQRSLIPLGPDLAIRTDDGYLLAPIEDPGLAIALTETRGRLEPGTIGVALALLHPGDTMIDVGSSIGTFAVPAAHFVGPAGRVIAVEPTPRIAALLRRTAALNGLGQIEVHECAAGDADCEAQLSLSPQTTHNSLIPPPDVAGAVTVALRRLDSLVPPGTPVALVKIDAEGTDLLVWRGMPRLLADNPGIAVILEFGLDNLARAGLPPENWLAEVTAGRRAAWEIDEPTGRLRPFRAERHDGVPSVNILVMRDSPAERGLLVA